LLVEAGAIRSRVQSNIGEGRATTFGNIIEVHKGCHEIVVEWFIEGGNTSKDGSFQVSKKVWFVHPSPADGRPFRGPRIRVLGKFLPFQITRYLEILQLSHIRNVCQIGHLLANRGHFFMDAHDAIRSACDQSTSNLWPGPSTLHLFHKTITLAFRQEVINNKNKGVFVDQLKARVVNIDLVKIGIAKKIVQRQIGVSWIFHKSIIRMLAGTCWNIQYCGGLFCR
jgi:hypothetical protein